MAGFPLVLAFFSPWLLRLARVSVEHGQPGGAGTKTGSDTVDALEGTGSG